MNFVTRKTRSPLQLYRSINKIFFNHLCNQFLEFPTDRHILLFGEDINIDTNLPSVLPERNNTGKSKRNAGVRVTAEASGIDDWIKLVCFDSRVIGLNRFGESAPAKVLFETFGLTVDNVVKAVEAQLG